MKVFFDATVWCGAILRPAGVSVRLLDLAARGGPMRGATSDVVLLEFYRHATGGTFNRRFEPEDVWDYVRAHQPLLEIEQAPVGRSLPSRTDLHNLPLNEVVYHLTGKTREDLLAELDNPRRRLQPSTATTSMCLRRRSVRRPTQSALAIRSSNGSSGSTSTGQGSWLPSSPSSCGLPLGWDVAESQHNRGN